MNALQFIANMLGRTATIKLLRLQAATSNLFKYGDADHFQQVFIEINGKCNRSCVYCPNAVAPQADDYMPRERFVKILERLREMDWSGPVAYHFLSEPTLHPQLVEFIALTREMLPKAKPVLFTNGDFLTPDLCRRLVDAGLMRSTVTRHPPVPPDWDARIDRLCAAHPGVFHKNRIAAADLMNPAGIMVNYKGDWKGRCVSPTRVMIIRMSGMVGICCCDHTNETKLGNMLTTPIETIWRNPMFKDIRTRLRRGERVFKICENCSGVE